MHMNYLGYVYVVLSSIVCLSYASNTIGVTNIFTTCLLHVRIVHYNDSLPTCPLAQVNDQEQIRILTRALPPMA